MFIYRYVTENTFDSYLWQTIENKQRFISQIMTSKTPVRIAEDVDESALSYAEIKALATGNPLIKEKMELDNKVTKLKILESSYNANRYQLEDNLRELYPERVNYYEKLISAVRTDIEIIKKNPVDEFSMEIAGVIYKDKKAAGEKLLEEIQKNKDHRSRQIGFYRNLKLKAQYNSSTNEYEFILSGKAKHKGTLGYSPEGNIQRIDNVINKLEERTLRLQDKLQEVKEQITIAEEQVRKPFEKAEELKQAIARLVVVNQLLETKNEYIKEDKLQEVKKEIIDFCNREYETTDSLEDFETLHQDIEHIGIAYTETPNEKHSIAAEINLKEFTVTTLVNGKPVCIENYLDEAGNHEKALEDMGFH